MNNPNASEKEKMVQERSVNQELVIKNRESFENLVINLEESRLKKSLMLIMNLSPGRCLDVACGSGEFSSRLIDLNWDAYGVAYSGVTGH